MMVSKKRKNKVNSREIITPFTLDDNTSVDTTEGKSVKSLQSGIARLMS